MVMCGYALKTLKIEGNCDGGQYNDIRDRDFQLTTLISTNLLKPNYLL